eukprot:1850499-Rhodomonas_salina.1
MWMSGGATGRGEGPLPGSRNAWTTEGTRGAPSAGTRGATTQADAFKVPSSQPASEPHPQVPTCAGHSEPWNSYLGTGHRGPPRARGVTASDTLSTVYYTGFTPSTNQITILFCSRVPEQQPSSSSPHACPPVSSALPSPSHALSTTAGVTGLQKRAQRSRAGAGWSGGVGTEGEALCRGGARASAMEITPHHTHTHPSRPTASTTPHANHIDSPHENPQHSCSASR